MYHYFRVHSISGGCMAGNVASAATPGKDHVKTRLAASTPLVQSLKPTRPDKSSTFTSNLQVYTR